MLLPLQGVKRDMVAYPGCRSLRSLCPGLSANPPLSGLIGLSARRHPRRVRLRRGGSRRHLRGRTALQANTEGGAAIRGRCPRLLTVQPSRLNSLACLILPLRHEAQRSHTCWRCPWHSTAFQAG